MTTTTKDLEALVDSIRKTREHYGLPPEPLEYPSLEEMKAADVRRAADLINATITSDNPGDPADVWLESGIHKRELPGFAYHTIMAGCWELEDTRIMAMMAWKLCEWPSQIGLEPWRQIWEATGYICDHDRRYIDVEDDCACTEAGPMTLYRAAFSSEKRGMSWTKDLDRAEWFAARGDMAGRGRKMRIWTAEVPPERRYAHFTGRSEAEFVCDVRGLRLQLANFSYPYD